PWGARVATAPADAAAGGDVEVFERADTTDERQSTQGDGRGGTVDLEHPRAVEAPRIAPAADGEPVGPRSLDCQVLGDRDLPARGAGIAEGDGEGSRGRVVTGVGGRDGELDGVAALGSRDLAAQRAVACEPGVGGVGDEQGAGHVAALERLQSRPEA